jgi:hypothetical protein
VFDDVSTLIDVLFPKDELDGSDTAYIFDDQTFS